MVSARLARFFEVILYAVPGASVRQVALTLRNTVVQQFIQTLCTRHTRMYTDTDITIADDGGGGCVLLIKTVVSDSSVADEGQHWIPSNRLVLAYANRPKSGCPLDRRVLLQRLTKRYGYFCLFDRRGTSPGSGIAVVRGDQSQHGETRLAVVAFPSFYRRK